MRGHVGHGTTRRMLPSLGPSGFRLASAAGCWRDGLNVGNTFVLPPPLAGHEPMQSIFEDDIMDITLPMKVETCSSQGSGRLRLVSRLGPDIIDVRVGPLCFIQKGKGGG